MPSAGVSTANSSSSNSGASANFTTRSVELIRRAAKSLQQKNPSQLTDYSRRVACRELKDLIRKATERDSGIFQKPDIQQMISVKNNYDSESSTTVASNNSNNNVYASQQQTVEEFVKLRQELQNILNSIEAKEAAVSALCAMTRLSMQKHNYEPLDALDIIVSNSSGTPIASSDMTFDSLKLLQRHWKEALPPSQQQKEKEQQQDASTQLGDVLFKMTQPKLEEEEQEGNNKNTSSSSGMEKEDIEKSMELSAQLTALMTDDFRVPRRIQSQLFTSLKGLSYPVRLLRLSFSVARLRDLIAARERFLDTIGQACNEIDANKKRSSLTSQKEGEEDFELPPQLFDLAEEMLPRLKAFEMAAGIPFCVDRKTAIRLMILPASSDARDEVPGLASIFEKLLPPSSGTEEDEDLLNAEEEDYYEDEEEDH